MRGTCHEARRTWPLLGLAGRRAGLALQRWTFLQAWPQDYEQSRPMEAGLLPCRAVPHSARHRAGDPRKPTLQGGVSGQNEKPQARTLKDIVSREEPWQAFHATRRVADRLVDLGLAHYRVGRERWFFVGEFLGFAQRQFRRQKGGQRCSEGSPRTPRRRPLPGKGVAGGPQAVAATTGTTRHQTVETQEVLQCFSAL